MKPLYGKEATEHSASAAALLTIALVRDTIQSITDDDDRFTAGIFAFVFADYFSRLLAGQFETAASLAVMMVLGQEEFDRCSPMIEGGFNRMVGSSAFSLEAIGTTCGVWYKNPTSQEFERLASTIQGGVNTSPWSARRFLDLIMGSNALGLLAQGGRMNSVEMLRSLKVHLPHAPRESFGLDKTARTIAAKRAGAHPKTGSIPGKIPRLCRD